MTTVDRLIELIEREGMKPAHIVRELDISSSSFTDWKKGKGSPSLEILIKFAKRFDVSLDWLVFGKEHNDLIRLSDPTEVQLLTKYRKLPSSNKIAVIAYVDGIIAAVTPAEEDNRKKASS